jgi:membrane protease subunit (stomatin/prohibitin family)
LRFPAFAPFPLGVLLRSLVRIYFKLFTFWPSKPPVRLIAASGTSAIRGIIPLCRKCYDPPQEFPVSLSRFLDKQFIDVIQWNEPEPGVLAYRYPMQDMEIQNGGQLTVRESEMALFVNEGRIADVFAPGLYTLNTHNLPVLTDLLNWDKEFESPFKSDVYFFSAHLQIDQKWGTATPITVRDKEFGAVRVRAYGIYSYRLIDPRTFFTQVSGTRQTYTVGELEDQLRNTIVARMTDIFSNADIAYLDMTANESALADKIAAVVAPAFKALGLELTQFVVENISLPEELQKALDQRIGMKMVGDLDRYTQYAAAESMTLAAANPSGAAGLGVGLAAGAAVGQSMGASLHPTPPLSTVPATTGPTDLPTGPTKFCIACGHPIPQRANFCPDCGKPQ